MQSQGLVKTFTLCLAGIKASGAAPTAQRKPRCTEQLAEEAYAGGMSSRGVLWGANRRRCMTPHLCRAGRPTIQERDVGSEVDAMICFDRTGTLHESAPAIRCFGFQFRPGGCFCDGMAKLRYPEYRG
jgi:hypothetical protein